MIWQSVDDVFPPRSTSERVRLETCLLDWSETGGTRLGDGLWLLTVHAALAAHDFRNRDIGSYLGGSLRASVVGPNCRRIWGIDTRDQASPGERFQRPDPRKTTGEMLSRLLGVPGVNLKRPTTVDVGTGELDPTRVSPDLSFQ